MTVIAKNKGWMQQPEHTDFWAREIRKDGWFQKRDGSGMIETGVQYTVTNPTHRDLLIKECDYYHQKMVDGLKTPLFPEDIGR
jgi:hypothetical protein